MKWIPLITILFLTACSSSLPIDIKTPPNSDVQLHQVLSNKAQYQNIPVRWGGMIIDTEDKTDTTILLVQFYPLDYRGRPEIHLPTVGRFMISSKLFNDRKRYAKGTEITVTGWLQQILEEQIDDQTTQHPIIKVDNHHVWPRPMQVYSDYGFPYYQRCQPWRAKKGDKKVHSKNQFCTPVTRAQQRIGSRDGTF